MKPEQPERKTILFINLYSEMGGGEHAIFNLLKYLDRSRFRPVMMFNKHGEFAEMVAQLGVETVILSYPSVMLSRLISPACMWSVLMGSTRIYRYLKQNRVDLIQCSDVLSLLLIALAVVGLRIPVLYSVIFFYEWPRMVVFNLLGLLLVDKIIVNSQALRSDLHRKTILLSNDISVVYHAVDGSVFFPKVKSYPDSFRDELGIPPSAKVVGMVGRFDPWKGHKIFLRVAASILWVEPDVRFVVLGGLLFADTFPYFRNYYEEVTEMCRNLGIEEKVTFLSHRNDIPEALRGLDVLVYPATRENIPLTIYEAMASKVPVVATDIGGIPEQITNGKEGYLVPPNDHDLLAKAIVRSLNTDTTPLTDAAYAKVQEQFSMTRYVAAMENTYKAMLSHRVDKEL